MSTKRCSYWLNNINIDIHNSIESIEILELVEYAEGTNEVSYAEINPITYTKETLINLISNGTFKVENIESITENQINLKIGRVNNDVYSICNGNYVEANEWPSKLMLHRDRNNKVSIENKDNNEAKLLKYTNKIAITGLDSKYTIDTSKSKLTDILETSEIMKLPPVLEVSIKKIKTSDKVKRLIFDDTTEIIDMEFESYSNLEYIKFGSNTVKVEPRHLGSKIKEIDIGCLDILPPFISTLLRIDKITVTTNCDIQEPKCYSMFSTIYSKLKPAKITINEVKI